MYASTLRVAGDFGVGTLGQHSPRASTVMVLDRSATTFRLCSTMSTVRFLATRRISELMRAMSSRPMPAIGSSSSITSGSTASVVAISSARLRP